MNPRIALTATAGGADAMSAWIHAERSASVSGRIIEAANCRQAAGKSASSGAIMPVAISSVTG